MTAITCVRDYTSARYFDADRERVIFEMQTCNNRLERQNAYLVEQNEYLKELIKNGRTRPVPRPRTDDVRGTET